MMNFRSAFLIFLFLLTFSFAPRALADVTAITAPNGGECLTVGQAFTITFTWSGASIEHVALYYRTDGAQPAHLDSSLIKHPLQVPQNSSWPWTPTSADISTTGRIWIDGHLNNHDSLNTWDSSNANFSVQSSCAANAGATRTATTETVRVTEVSSSGATVNWTTAAASYTKLEYGTSSAAYTKDYSVDPSITRFNHTAVLTGLEPSTAYYFRTISGATQSERLTSYEYSFATLAAPDTAPPGPVGQLFGVPGATTALLSWVNPGDPDFQEVTAVRRADRAPEHSSDGDVVFRGRAIAFTDAKLRSGTTYRYALFALDRNGNASPGAQIAIMPLLTLGEAPVAPPPNTVTAVAPVQVPLATAGEGKVSLSWKNPGDQNFLGVHIVRSTSTPPANPYDGTVVFRGRAEGFEDLGLDAETRHHYGFFVFDWGNRFSNGTLVAATPRAPAPPLPSPPEPGGTPQPQRAPEERSALSKTLRVGMQDKEVRTLQDLLARDPEIYPEGLVTGYFGPLTRRAVQRFQETYGIVSEGTEATTGYGLVGPRTRTKLAALASGERIPKTHTVSIESDGFRPAALTVKTGDTVVWMNLTERAAWPAADPHPQHTSYPGFDVLRGLRMGERYSFTFDKAGAWGYHDHLDATHVGKITVTPR